MAISNERVAMYLLQQVSEVLDNLDTENYPPRLDMAVKFFLKCNDDVIVEATDEDITAFICEASADFANAMTAMTARVSTGVTQ